MQNYCPLVFTTETGRNITPAEFRSDLKKVVVSHCDLALLNTINLLQTTDIVAIGKFVYDRVNQIRNTHGLEVNVHYLMHPSPANPAANKGWGSAAELTFNKLNIL